jgi:L-2,4-diaminobutyrate decarboxylase
VPPWCTPPGVDLIHRTVECTKAALGLRMFAVLAALGERGVADYIDRQFELTRESYELLCGMPGLECPAEPQSNILCFRVTGGDEEQLRVRDRLLAEGDFHLSTAVVGGRRYLRVVMTNPATTLDDIRRLAARVLEIATPGNSD